MSYPFLVLFFSSYLKNKLFKKTFEWASLLFLLFSIGLFLFSNTFFTAYSPYVNISGTLLVLIVIISFYFELLRSEYVMQLKRFLPFYFSLGTFVFLLCVTPLSIFSDYFRVSTGNHLFVKLQVQVILYSNIFMYSCFTLGFILCSRKKKYS